MRSFAWLIFSWLRQLLIADEATRIIVSWPAYSLLKVLIVGFSVSLADDAELPGWGDAVARIVAVAAIGWMVWARQWSLFVLFLSLAWSELFMVLWDYVWHALGWIGTPLVLMLLAVHAAVLLLFAAWYRRV